MRFFIFIILVITFLTVDHPQVNDIRNTVISWIGITAEEKYSRGKVSATVYKEVSSKFSSFKPNEEAYVKEITATSKDLMTFYETYCKGAFNPKISRYNQNEVCKVIDKHYDDLDNEIIRQRNRD